MSRPTTSQEKALGSLLGGAIGDAFGHAYEGSVPPVEISQHARWQISDDTQLTLATCEAIIEQNGLIDPQKVASRFALWHRQKRITGVGASTYKALTELAAGGHWALVGAKGERAAGNGAAMRIAPLAFLLDPADEGARRTIRDICRITHQNEEAYVGALAVVVAMRAAAGGESHLLDAVTELLPDSRVRDRLAEMQRSSANRPLLEVAEEFGTSGYVVESVPLALYGAQQVEEFGFEGLLRELIQCGGDTDTIASIAGQVMGAYLGSEQLPAGMLSRLPEKEMIEAISYRFAGMLSQPGNV